MAGVEPWENLLEASSEVSEVSVDELDDCEILYTSGTTGRPKGALFEHHRILHVGWNVIAGLGINSRDRILHAAPLFHCAQLNLFLVSGALVVRPMRCCASFALLKCCGQFRTKESPSFSACPPLYSRLCGVYLPPERHMEKLSTAGIPFINTGVRVVDGKGASCRPVSLADGHPGRNGDEGV